MRLFHLLTLALAMLVAVAWPAEAQTDIPGVTVSVDILVIPAAGDPVTVPAIAQRNTPIADTSPLCNLAAPPTSPTTTTPGVAGPALPIINPTQAEFDDPFTPARVCRVLIPVGLPNGSYRLVAVARSVDNLAPRSAASLPFDLKGKPGSPAVLTGLAVKP